MLRILTLSDTHTELPPVGALPEADMLVHCGDWTNGGFAADEMGQVEEWVGAALKRYPFVLALYGNHDIGVRNHHWENLGVVPLDGNTWEHPSSLTFHGVALTTAYEMPELAQFWDHMTINPEAEAAMWAFEKVDVVVAHGPPYGHLDLTFEGKHVGSREALRYIRKHQPKLYVCGHIHEAAGEVRLGRTRVVNLARKVVLLQVRERKKT